MQKTGKKMQNSGAAGLVEAAACARAMDTAYRRALVDRLQKALDADLKRVTARLCGEVAEWSKALPC
jgi:hypothetical protein